MRKINHQQSNFNGSKTPLLPRLSSPNASETKQISAEHKELDTLGQFPQIFQSQAKQKSTDSSPPAQEMPISGEFNGGTNTSIQIKPGGDLNCCSGIYFNCCSDNKEEDTSSECCIGNKFSCTIL